LKFFTEILFSFAGLAVFICAVLVVKAGISRFRSPLENEKLHLHGIPVLVPSHTRFNGCLFIASGGFIIILFLVILLSVIFHKQDENTPAVNSQKLSTKDSVSNTVFSPAVKSKLEREFITDRFYKIVKIIDSSGYYADSIKYRLSYQYPDSAKIHVIDSDIFYEIPLSQSMPYFMYQNHLYNSKREDYDIYKSVKNIVCFHFIRKEESEIFYGDEKWFPDGIVEEWTFPDSISARLAAEDYCKSSGLIIFNSGAYLCYIDNYMYVFYSRAAIFTGFVKIFYERFIKDNNAIKPKIFPRPFSGLVP
jgi:hypothetical protein